MTVVPVAPCYRFAARVHRVVDGDTYHLTIELGFHCAITVPVRLRGVDTPEMNTEAGKAARAWVVNHIQLPAPPLVVETYRDRQTFARWICDIHVSGRSLADLLVEAGHGVPST